MFSPSATEHWLSAIFEAQGVATDHASATASCLLRAEMRGIRSHGLGRAGDYIARLKAGFFSAGGAPVVSRRGPVHEIDGRLALGPAVAASAMAALTEYAGAHGIAVGRIRHSGHMGALGLHALAAAEKGMLAFFAQETRPAIRPEGSWRAAIGNNPFAFAAPIAGQPPLVFDVASSAVAHGKIVNYAAEGKALAPGWAVGPDGIATVDPMEALKGGLLPFAGHKGLGMAMMVQCLAGSLNETMLRRDQPGADGSSAGDLAAFCMVLDPLLILGEGRFTADMASWMDFYRGSFTPPGRYPGLQAHENEVSALTNGFSLSGAAIDRLNTLGREAGAGPFPSALP